MPCLSFDGLVSNSKSIARRENASRKGRFSSHEKGRGKNVLEWPYNPMFAYVDIDMKIATA